MQIGMTRCDAIAVTGNLTGEETSMDKIRSFRDLLEAFPLIVAAGVTPQNVEAQLKIGDACIVGSYFKENHSVENMVNAAYVKEFMEKVSAIRKGESM